MSADPYTPRAGSAADLALQHLRLHGTTPEHVLADAIDKELDELQPLLQHAVRCGALHRHRVDVGWAWSLGAADHPDAGGAPRQTVVPAASCAPPETSAPRSVFEVPVFMDGSSAGQTSVESGSQTPEGAAIAGGVRAGKEPTRGASTGIRARAAGLATEACEGAGAELPSRSSTTSEPADVGAEAAQVPTRVQPPATPIDGGELRAETRFALWSDGVLEIQHGAERVGLSQDTTRRLFAYLDRMREGA